MIKRIGETQHQSCLILTSRERPREISHETGRDIRLLSLTDLELSDCKTMLRNAAISGTDEALVALYSGNPLSLQIISVAVKESFDGDIVHFLKEGTSIFGNVYDLLDKQFLRLASSEKEVLYRLAIEREPVSMDTLMTSSIQTSFKGDLLTTLNTLFRRNLIESRTTSKFTLQPVIMEYIVGEIIKKVCQEIELEKLQFLLHYALIHAQARDYIRESQIQLIFKPIADQLLKTSELEQVAERLLKMLADLRERRSHKFNYMAGNLLNLLV